MPELLHMITPLIPLPPPNAESLSELSKVENADPTAILSVQFDPDGKRVVSGGYSGTIKVWGALAFLAVSHDLAAHHALSFGRCLVPGFGG